MSKIPARRGPNVETEFVGNFPNNYTARKGRITITPVAAMRRITYFIRSFVILVRRGRSPI
jgi:hypothetical protein